MRKYLIFISSLILFLISFVSNTYGNGIPLPTFISFDGEANKYVVTRNGDFTSDEAYDDIFTRDYASSQSTYLGNLNIDFDGNNKEIIGLVKPLFYSIGSTSEVINLKLVTSNGVSDFIALDSLGTGVLAKDSSGTITNVQVSGNIDASNQNYVGGLVGQTHDGAVVDVTSTVNVSHGGDYIGGLIGRTNTGVNVTDSFFIGNVSGTNNVGGLIGDSQGNVSGSYSTGTVSGISWVGGLIGYATSANVNESWSSSQVTGNEFVGGLVGASFRNSTILDSYAAGNVEGQFHIGGLVGVAFSDDSSYNENLISNSHATGLVTGNRLIGGLVGSMGDPYIGYAYTYKSELRNSYASGNVIGTDYSVGGLVGQAFGQSIIKNSISFGDVNGSNNIGGLVGALQGSIENSRALGNVSGVTTIGGLVGQQINYSSIEDSAAYGNVNGSLQESCGDDYFYCDRIGGIVGLLNSNASITRTYALGDVTGYQSVGALVGEAYGEITNSWASGLQSSEIEPLSYFVGFCGRDTNRYFCEMGEGSEPASNLLPEVLPSLDLSIENQLQILNFENETNHFASKNCINSGVPYLVSLANSYSNSCSQRAPLKILSTSEINRSKPSTNFVVSTKRPDTSCFFDVKDISLDSQQFRIKFVELKMHDSLSSVFLGIHDHLQIGLSSKEFHDWQVWINDPNCGEYKVGELEKPQSGFADAVLPSIEFKAKGNYQILIRNPSSTSNSIDVPYTLQIFVTVE